jgi:hypothetical protein
VLLPGDQNIARSKHFGYESFESRERQRDRERESESKTERFSANFEFSFCSFRKTLTSEFIYKLNRR